MAGGLNQECYVLGHKVVLGNTTQSDLWQKVETLITKPYYKKDGSLIYVSAACFDSGGHSTLSVYEFSTRMMGNGYRVYAIKGQPGVGDPAFRYKANISGSHRAHRYYSVSSHTTKGVLFDRLKIDVPGEHYIHFSNTLNAEYFQQLTCESPKWEIYRGKSRKVWVQAPGTRREAPDCWRYGFAALYADLEYEYLSACDDYIAKQKNEVRPVQPTVSKSRYVESHKYK